MVVMMVTWAWYLPKHPQVWYSIACGLLPVTEMAGVHTRKPSLLTSTHHFFLTLCCLPGEFIRRWEKEKVWNEKSEYEQWSAEVALWSHLLHFSNGVKRPLYWREQNPGRNPLPYPNRENIEGFPGDLRLFQACKPKLVLHPLPNFQEQNNTLVP